MKSIVLLGYMGAGKTTIGHALAKVLGVTFYDLDWYIEMRFHKTVAQVVLGLEVPHAHIHLIPMNSEADVDFRREKLKLSSEEMASIAEAIRNNF